MKVEKMKGSKKLLVILLVFVLSLPSVVAQNEMTLAQFEDSIQENFTNLISLRTDSLRMIANTQIVSLFDNVLSQRESFDYPFEKLKNVSKLSTADGRVRIINWNIPEENGEYMYFCYIQRLDKKLEKLRLYKLKDASANIENPKFKKLDKENWYGSLYYYVRTDYAGQNTYYTLFGWDGNTNFSNKKMIECFYFDKNKLILGPPVFKMEKAVQNRLVFEFAKQAKMMLRYDEKIKMIVYDHLAPSHKKFEEQFMYYGPDMSQDGIQFIDGYWVLKPNLDLRNMEKSTGKSIKKSY